MKVELKIEGMHCPSCSMLISDALEDVGVDNSNINSETGIGIIEFDESKVSLDKIKKTIEDEGYKVK